MRIGTIPGLMLIPVTGLLALVIGLPLVALYGSLRKTPFGAREAKEVLEGLGGCSFFTPL